jgi:hypothetical protein
LNSELLDAIKEAYEKIKRREFIRNSTVGGLTLASAKSTVASFIEWF